MRRLNSSLSALRRARQRGVALYVVIVFVMLSMLLASWAARGSLFNEIVVGNDADYRRAFEAAQAMLQDAELDVLGQTADGSACTPDMGSSANAGKICRRTTSVWFVDEEKDVVGLLYTLESQPTVPCLQGICAKRTGKQDFWNDAETLGQMRAVGARYGEYTGARKGSGSNPILQATADGQGAWYWVEVMPYATSSTGLITNLGGAAKLELNLNPAVVYRITAVAQGLKESTQVVLQATLARQKLKD